MSRHHSDKTGFPMLTGPAPSVYVIVPGIPPNAWAALSTAPLLEMALFGTRAISDLNPGMRSKAEVGRPSPTNLDL